MIPYIISINIVDSDQPKKPARWFKHILFHYEKVFDLYNTVI